LEKRGQQTNSATLVVNNDCNALWCSCQNPEGGRFMICCDVRGEGCKIWYHGGCVGITKIQGKKMEKNNEDYLCPVCLVASETATQLPPYTPFYHLLFLE